jgi:2-succinyl-6-hydroxy-2,4-cyclohexadiene-1-carboxylate synthase
LTTANYQFYYSLDGDRTQPVILFLHGFMGNSHEFDEAIQLLKHNFYCLKVDLPGHGNTKVLGSEDSYTMANTAQGLIELLDNLQIHQCFLVGYSMGGRLALYLTLYFPHRFPKVILESASPGLATAAERQERMKRDGQIARKLERSLEKNDFIAFLRNWYQQPIFGNIKNHPHFQHLLKIRIQNNPIELAKSLRLMGTGCQPSLWEKLKDNSSDLLLIVGKNDEKFIEINQKMAEICQHCHLKIVSHASHNIHFEKPKDFVENIKLFLNA